jgi:hypothetical protein
MKKLTLALGTAAAMALAALAAPAQAQPHHGPRGYHPRVVVVTPPPPRHIVRHDRYRDHGRYHHARRDSDRDGVPDRFDRRPHNPYRR